MVRKTPGFHFRYENFNVKLLDIVTLQIAKICRDLCSFSLCVIAQFEALIVRARKTMDILISCVFQGDSIRQHVI